MGFMRMFNSLVPHTYICKFIYLFDEIKKNITKSGSLSKYLQAFAYLVARGDCPPYIAVGLGHV